MTNESNLADHAAGRGANLAGADLCDADLCDADLRSADLRSADLRGAYLTDAYLIGADLTGANLTRANLTDANLIRAYLTDANLTRANLTRADFTRAKGVIALGQPNGWWAFAYLWQGSIWVCVGCRTFPMDQARVYWAGKDNRREVVAALDYAEMIARLRGWEFS
jgi:hypothetical protein